MSFTALARTRVISRLQRLFRTRARPNGTRSFTNLLSFRISRRHRFSNHSINVGVRNTQLITIRGHVRPNIFKIKSTRHTIRTFFHRMVIKHNTSSRHNGHLILNTGTFRMLRRNINLNAIFTLNRPITRRTITNSILNNNRKLGRSTLSVITRHFST